MAFLGVRLVNMTKTLASDLSVAWRFFDIP